MNRKKLSQIVESIIRKEIDDLNSSECEQALRIYSSSFPPVETKPVEKILDMLKNDDYHLYVVIKNHNVVGFSLLYVFRTLEVGLLDYMAIIPDHHGRGLGTEIFRYTVDEFRSQVTNPVGLLLEIQREDALDPNEYTKRKRRIRFYARLNVKVLEGVRYLLPPQHGDEPEETYLMMLPLRKIHSLSSDLVLQYIKAVYKKVYQYERNDLLEKIAQTLPKTIKLSNITT